MSNKSMVDIAYDYAKQFKDPVPFKDLWAEVVKELELSEEEAQNKIGIFYTNLSLDCRFHSAGDNTWMLRSRMSFDDATADLFFVKDDVNDSDDEDEDEDDEDSNDEDEDEDEDDEEEHDEDEDDSIDSDIYDNEDE